MSFDEFAIKVENLSKCYQIYDKPNDRLKQFLLPRLQRFFRRPQKQYFRGFWALKEVSFEVKKGETVGIIGRNGSGKSTLLQMICGTLTPTSGSIQTNGRIAALLELGSGFNPEFTGRENIYMNATVLGLTKDEIDARFDDIVAFADIGDFIEQPVKTYSSGMVVRVAFAVIAHVDADILVVDEALAVGDAFFTQKCMRFLRNFMATGTILFVSHDTGAVVNLCKRGILLKDGQVAEIGRPKEIIEHYLATLYESDQEIKGVVIENNNNTNVSYSKDFSEYRDMRESLFNNSILRNDIEVFRFEADQPGFGAGYAKIVSVRLLDQEGIPLSWVVGGEEVILEIRSIAEKDMLNPIVGFQFKDRLGQVVFSDNTYLVYKHQPQIVEKSCEIIAKFVFRLPIIPAGDYSFTAALADGSQDGHVQQHWIHDALIIKAHSSSIFSGIIGVPMKEIRLEISKIISE